MSCSNCYNGCPQIISDQCVKYTGIDIPVLGIKNGDSLSYVEQAIITFLTSTLDGTGIKPNIEQSIICQIVSKNLPTCGDLTVVDFIKALTQAVCELKTIVDGTIADIDDINDFIISLESAYDVSDCLTGVTSTSGTHDILQAVIDSLCDFIRDAPTTYVQLEYLNGLIADYLASIAPTTVQYNTRMVPYTIVAYYGSLSNFSASGVGISANGFDKIYLCNGQNTTPDLRGRTIVGTTSMGTNPFDPSVDPAIPGNPNYAALGTAVGLNNVTLTSSQIPAHTHLATAVSSVTDPTHRHKFSDDTTSPTNALRANNGIIPFTTSPASATISADGAGAGRIYLTSPESTGVSVSTTVTVQNNTGGNGSHINIQPSLACHYIMYIP
jgi:microcystin-dependent protein